MKGNQDKLGIIAFGKTKQLEKKLKELEERLVILEKYIDKEEITKE